MAQNSESTAEQRHLSGVTRYLALGAVAGPVLFTAAWLVLGLSSPAYYTPWLTIPKHSGVLVPISWLALGPSGPFMNTAFVLGGLLLLAGVVAIFHGMRRMSGLARWSCIVLLALSPLGLIVCGLFPMDSMIGHRAAEGLTHALLLPALEPTQFRLHDTYYIVGRGLLPFVSPIHSLGVWLAVATPVLGFFAAGCLLRRVPDIRRFGGWLLLGSLLTLGLLMVFLATFDPYRAMMVPSQVSILRLGGIPFRLLMIEVQAWFVALGWIAFARSAPPV